MSKDQTVQALDDAIRESSRDEHADEYFAARPQLDFIGWRRVFEAGFDRGWKAAADIHPPLEPPK